jgi:hypothetical protein
MHFATLDSCLKRTLLRIMVMKINYFFDRGKNRVETEGECNGPKFRAVVSFLDGAGYRKYG